MIVKVALSWVPGRHLVLRRFGIFKHGRMDETDYALKIFRIHAQRAFPGGFPKNFVALELGPGDSVLSALIAAAHGADKIYLSDAGNYARKDLAFYQAAAAELRAEHDLNVPDISGAQNFKHMLELCGAVYMHHGLNNLQTIAERSVDFIWSHSVVEHIRKKDFDATMENLIRILNPMGRISHIVDLQDHLNHALNNLRFPDAFWEHEIIANAGFYTNRLGYDRALESMRAGGAQILETESGCWEALPTPRKKMAARFQTQHEDDLRVRTYSVLLKAA